MDQKLHRSAIKNNRVVNGRQTINWRRDFVTMKVHFADKSMLWIRKSVRSSQNLSLNSALPQAASLSIRIFNSCVKNAASSLMLITIFSCCSRIWGCRGCFCCQNQFRFIFCFVFLIWFDFSFLSDKIKLKITKDGLGQTYLSWL